jgi:phage tail-like protein
VTSIGFGSADPSAVSHRLFTLAPDCFTIAHLRSAMLFRRRLMARFTVNATRFDPYKDFKFRVKWDGRTVAGVSKVSALERTTEVIEHRDGGDPSSGRRLPGMSRYEPITLERGLSHDGEFENWAGLVLSAGGAQPRKYRKDVRLELLDEAGQVMLAYTIFRCWPSQYVAVPDLDEETVLFAFESLVLENEGWVRDPAVPKPTGPAGKRKSRS